MLFGIYSKWFQIHFRELNPTSEEYNIIRNNSIYYGEVKILNILMQQQRTRINSMRVYI